MEQFPGRWRRTGDSTPFRLWPVLMLIVVAGCRGHSWVSVVVVLTVVRVSAMLNVDRAPQLKAVVRRLSAATRQA